MRLLLATILAALLWAPAIAANGVVYPSGTTVSFTSTISADTVTLLIHNTHETPVTGLFVTEHTVNVPQLIACQVDGYSFAGLVTEQDTLFPGSLTTRWLISSFQTEVRLVYLVPGYANSQLHWVAQQDGPVFGLAYNHCCMNRRGNVDNDPADRVDLTDLALLVVALTRGGVQFQCRDEANVNGDPRNMVDLPDLSTLVAYLVSGGFSLPLCPNQ